MGIREIIRHPLKDDEITLVFFFFTSGWIAPDKNGRLETFFYPVQRMGFLSQFPQIESKLAV